ncbi:MAG: hypothetical protein CMN31_20215 [Sandaracinus sp.]|nr:hypothetical protein [Sandaracinus sp.]
MSADRSMVRSLPAICQFGRYELLGRLAVGGMAEIYLARETSAVQGAGARHVVIKRVLQHVADDETFVTMFFDEARLAMRLHHPNIVHLYEFGEEAGSYFIAMEWIDGVALGKLIRKARDHDGIPAPISVKVIARIAEALHYAHHLRGDDGQPLGIVHRDVSPQNIMVSYEGTVKLLDFGIAKASIQHTKTQDGQVKGKFAYMSPEQCLGEPLDGRGDIFALGVCLFEALTGRPLYHRKTQYETMRAVLEEPVPSVRKHRPEIPEALDRLVQRALAKKPDDRFADAGQMQVELERWLAIEQEVVPQTRIEAYLHDLFGEDLQQGPMVDSTPFGESFQIVEQKEPIAPPPVAEESLSPPAGVALGAPVGPGAPIEVDLAEPEEDLPARRALWIVGGILLLLAVGFGVAWALLGGEGPAQAAEVAATTPTPVEPAPASAMQAAAIQGSAMQAEAPTPAEPVAPEPTMEEAPAARGSVLFRSEPSGATVQLGERRVPGTTPTALGDVEVGEYAVVMERDGYRSWAGTVRVEADERAEIEGRLRPIRRASAAPRMREAPAMEEAPSAPGSVSINTRPWSKVYVGSRLLGTTPIGRAEVPAGNVRLRIVDRDGNEHARSVSVMTGEDTRVFYDLSDIR